MLKKLIFVLVLAGCFDTAASEGAFADASPPNDEGWRTALQEKQIDVRICDERYYARAFCEQMARDFARGSEVQPVAPEYTTTTIDDPRLRQITSCIGQDLENLLLLELPQAGLGRAQGPFALYRVTSSGSVHDRFLLQIRGYVPETETVKPGDMYGWSSYYLIEPATCQHRAAMTFYHGYNDTTKLTQYWDAVVRVSGEPFLFSVDEYPESPGEFRVVLIDIDEYSFDAKRHPILVSFIAR